MGETIIIERIPISHSQRAWIRTVMQVYKKTKKRKKTILIKRDFVKVKLSPSEKLKQYKIKKRIYDIKYYATHKEEINIRQRRNYHLCKKESNTKFI